MKKILFTLLCFGSLIVSAQNKDFHGKTRIDSLYSQMTSVTTADTATFKPVVANADGKFKRSTYWYGSGVGGGYTTLSQFVDETAWRLFYSNTSGDVTPLAFGTSGQYLKSNGTTSAPGWETPASPLATYITQTSTNAPANAQILADLGTGLLKNTSGTGVLSIAVPGTDYATASGIHYEAAVKYATTAALAANTYNNGASGVGATLTGDANGAISVDGATPSVNDRILVKNEATQSDNGIYIVTTVGDAGTAYVLTRASDFDQSAEIIEGDAVFVTLGTANDGTSWYQATAGTITIGTTSIVFTQFNNESSPIVIGTTVVQSGTNTRVLFNNSGVVGEYTISGTGNVALTTSAALTTPTVATTITPVSDDGAALGTTSLNWSDLHLATGANINFQNGNVLLTHSSGVLTVGTGDLRVTTAGTNTASVVTVGGTQTLTAKRITQRSGTVASSATPTINTDNVDLFTITALTVAITSMTTNLSGTPVEGDYLEIWITGTASRAITWGASFADGTVALPTTTVGTTTMMVLLQRKGSLWICKAAGSSSN